MVPEPIEIDDGKGDKREAFALADHSKAPFLVMTSSIATIWMAIISGEHGIECRYGKWHDWWAWWMWWQEPVFNNESILCAYHNFWLNKKNLLCGGSQSSFPLLILPVYFHYYVFLSQSVAIHFSTLLLLLLLLPLFTPSFFPLHPIKPPSHLLFSRRISILLHQLYVRMQTVFHTLM